MFGLVGDEARRGGIPVLFAVFWSVFVSLVCVIIAAGAARQINSARWPTTTGTITASEIFGSRRNSWKFEYTYTVAGQQHTGTKFAHDPMPIQGEQEVLRHVSVYPVGASVTVSYNPFKPGEAVLQTGLRGCTLWIVLFLAPFVLVGMGMWAGIVQRDWWRPALDPD